MFRTGLNELDAVIAIARERSFRAAARILGVSTTALSNAVAKLEGDLGVRLFNRTTRSVSLTDAGRAFIEQMSPALQDIHAAMEAVRSQQTTPTGTLRINAFAAGAREILSPLVLEFLRRYPEVQIDIVTEERLVDIVAEGFDLGLRRADMVPADMIAIPLGRPQRYAIVGSAKYFETHDAPNGILFRWRFEKDGEIALIDAPGSLTLDEASLMRTAVLEGVGIGLLLEQDIREDIQEKRVVRVLEDWTPPFADLALYYPSRRNPSAAFKAFIDLARQTGKAATA